MNEFIELYYPVELFCLNMIERGYSPAQPELIDQPDAGMVRDAFIQSGSNLDFRDALRKMDIDPMSIGRLDIPVGDLSSDFAIRRFQIGALAAQHPSGEIPEDIDVRFAPWVQNSKLSVSVTNPSSWYQCPSTESRFIAAMNDQALVRVNDHMFVKLVGKLTAIPVRSFSTETSTFIEGNYYCPVDPNLRERIVRGYIEGESDIQVDEGNWLLTRSVHKDDFDYFMRDFKKLDEDWHNREPRNDKQERLETYEYNYESPINFYPFGDL